jgi:hypothetical protein
MCTATDRRCACSASHVDVDQLTSFSYCVYVKKNARSAVLATCTFVNCTEARARGGEGPPWGFTVIPLVGDTCRAMQPQVSLTSGRAHTRAAPGDAPGFHLVFICLYVCLYVVLSTDRLSMRVMGSMGMSICFIPSVHR